MGGGAPPNQKLSAQRAELVHAVLMGERDTFAKIADETGTEDDWKQILKWSSEAFLHVPKLRASDEEEPDPRNHKINVPGSSTAMVPRPCTPAGNQKDLGGTKRNEESSRSRGWKTKFAN